MKTRLWIGGIVAAAVAAGAVSVATATIPDAAGVIHGCYSTVPPSGQLRVIDTDKVRSCGQYEKALDWNAQGRPGATGPTGPTGSSGVSTGWFKAGNGACINTCTLFSLSLPAGTFMVSMNGQASDAIGGDGQIRVQCYVAQALGISASVFVTGQAASLAASGVVSLGAAGSLDVKCNDNVPLGTPADLEGVGLTAIQVDKANVE